MSQSSQPTVLETLPAFLGNTRSQLRQRTLLFRYLAIINVIIGGWYLSWRYTHSINPDALILSVLLVLAETYTYVGGIMFVSGLWRPVERQVRSLKHLTPPLPEPQWPAVDVFIACYNEPVEMVEATARAALAMDYPANKLKVYVLDDGNSAAMRQMVERLCLEDLASPAVQAIATQLQAQQADIEVRLAELTALKGEVAAAEAYLDGLPPEAAQQVPACHVATLGRCAQLLSPGPGSLVERVAIAIQTTEAERHNLELALADLARSRYIARPKPEGRPHHAKAGNINYAMFSGKTNGEFILTLDADHIPKPRFLQRVLPYFYRYNLFRGRYDDSRIAFVQTPQDFYNLPPDDPFCHSAHLFYGPIQQGKDGLNAAFYTGTNAVLRREALIGVGLHNFAQAFEKDNKRLDEFDLIGGMSSASITEDMNTAMRLHAAGWRSVYHSELLAVGLAPDDLSATLKQRLRWAQGTLQVLRTENPLLKPGLAFWQRIQYFHTMYSYFSGFATLVFLICPIIYFFTGIIPVRAFGPAFVLHFLPAYLVNRMMFSAIAWGIPSREIWRSEQYATALFPLYIKAVFSVFSSTSLQFQVTPKQRQAGVYLGLVRSQLIVAVLLILGILWKTAQAFMGQLDDPFAFAVNTGWSIYSLTLLAAVIRAAVWQPPPESADPAPTPSSQ
jgi:cellulose synthase (UDP-forming)